MQTQMPGQVGPGGHRLQTPDLECQCQESAYFCLVLFTIEPLGGSRGESSPCPSPSFWGPRQSLAFLGCRHITRISA